MEVWKPKLKVSCTVKTVHNPPHLLQEMLGKKIFFLNLNVESPKLQVKFHVSTFSQKKTLVLFFYFLGLSPNILQIPLFFF